MVIVVREHRLRAIAELEKERDITGGSEHRTDVQFVSRRRKSLDLLHERFADAAALICRAYREQTNHTHAPRHPEAHRAYYRVFPLGHTDHFVQPVEVKVL